MHQNRQASTQLDICIVNSPLRVLSQMTPQALLWLIGWVEAKGYSAELVDVKRPPMARLNKNEIEDVFRETVERAVSSGARFIGLSCFTGEFSTITRLAREIKKRCNAKIIVGGVHSSISPKDYFTINDSPYDIAVIGEGEETLEEILKKGRSGNADWESIHGILFKKDGRIVRTQDRNFRKVMDDMPIPPYHKLDMNHYLRPQTGLLRLVLCSGVHIFTSQGCPYACTFCANSRRKVRYRKLEHVIEEIHLLKERYDIDGFYLQDDTFTINPKRVIEFCERFNALKLNIVWGIEGRVNQFPDNVFKTLVNSGCIQIDFGVETGSQRMLDRMKKGTKVEDAEGIFKLCRDNGVRSLANFLLNTPGETEEDVRQTLDLSKRIKATVIYHSVTIPYPGTPIYNEYVKPPLTIEEYDLIEGKGGTRSGIIDPRFRLAAHNLDIDRLALKVNIRFTIFQRIAIFSFHPRYLRMFLESSRKRQYMYAALSYIFLNGKYFIKALFERIWRMS